MYTRFLQSLSVREKDLLLVFFVTLLFRLPFLFAVGGDPYFRLPIIDSLEFHAWARDILLRFPGGWETMRTHPPLYSYFLALVYKLFGFGPMAAAVVQHVMFAASAALLYLAAASISGRSAALAACAVLNLYWFPLYLQTFIYSENLSLFLNLALLCGLQLLPDRGWKYPAAGLTLGLSAACRPEIAVFAALALPWFLRGENAPARPGRAYLSFLLGCVLVLAPLLAHVYGIAGRLTIRDYFGANLYIGNTPQFNGTLSFVGTGKRWADFITTPARETGRRLSDGESDNYFVRKTLRVIAADPGAWARLTAAKAAGVLLGREFLRTEDVYILDGFLAARPYYRLLPLPAIFFLALAGLGFSLRSPRRALLPGLLLLSGGALLFFPLNMRYFMPFFPLLALYAGGGAAGLVAAAAERRAGILAAAAAAACLYAGAFRYGPMRYEQPGPAEAYYAIAKNYAALGAPEAEGYFLASLRLDPEAVSTLNDLGALLAAAGRAEAALPYFRRAAELAPGDAMIAENYAGCLRAVRAAAR